MKLFSRIYQALFGNPNPLAELHVVFHKETNKYGTHGTINVSSAEQGLKDVNVRFLFVGLARPPEMTPTILYHLWHQAESQGYIPNRLVSYGSVLATTTVPLQAIISAERRQQEAFATNSTRFGAHAGATAGGNSELVQSCKIAIDAARRSSLTSI